ncbi:MAG TPA: hypothetical protein VNN80_30065 [Polyangiaceae bacterium]|nr:hypothetical protein [Polyangiaceae bacterium]
MASSAVLRSRARLNHAQLQRVLRALPGVFERVSELDLYAEAFDLPGDALPEPTLFDGCLTQFHVTGYLPRDADVSSELRAVLSHDFSSVSDVLQLVVVLALEVDGENDDGIESLGLRHVGARRDFELKVTGPFSAEACARAYDRVIDAAGLPLLLNPGEHFVVEHTGGGKVRTSGTRVGFPPGSVYCTLAPEPLERSFERLALALGATGADVRQASWGASGVQTSPERVQAAYRSLCAAKLPSRYYSGNVRLLPTISQGLAAIAALAPADTGSRPRVVAEVQLQRNTISVLVRSGLPDYELILVGTHALDGSWLERRLGIAWVPLTPA